MVAQSFSKQWEKDLLALAGHPVTLGANPAERVGNASVDMHSAEPGIALFQHPEALEQAYQQCALISSEYSRSFHIATALLPAAKRQAIRALYAFCRITDNLADCGGDEPEAALEEWKAQALSEHPGGQDHVLLAWADTRRSYGVPFRYAQQLIEGVKRDLGYVRYQSFEELAHYAYGVASTVGLMSMHIIGYKHHSAPAYAIKLGVALQITNILRDVAEDWKNGRLYLPLKELNAYGLSEQAVAEGRVDERWRAFMRFQIARNRRLYTEAWPGIAMLHPDGRFAVTAAATLYQGILDDIEAHDYDVFSRRAHLSDWKKIRRLYGIYKQSRRMQFVERPAI